MITAQFVTAVKHLSMRRTSGVSSLFAPANLDSVGLKVKRTVGLEIRGQPGDGAAEGERHNWHIWSKERSLEQATEPTAVEQ